MAKFKVGDKVRVKTFNERPAHWNPVGEMDHLMGQIVKIDRIYNGRYVINDRWNTLCHTWYMCDSDFEPVTQDTIVIYRKGSNVIALDKRDGKKAVAKCSPEDTFDFATGAKIAFDRLIGNEKPKETEYWSGKAVCVENRGIRDGFTVGKVYTFINGKTTDDYGCERPRGYRIKTLKGYEERTGILKFIEYKGEHGDAK